MLGIAPKSVCDALKRAGIEVRSTNLGRKFPEVGKKHSEWLKGRYAGDKNPNWRGNAVGKYSRDRQSYAAKEWATKVKQRDGYKCVECGSQGPLHSHHIVSWRRSVELRYEVSNGLTLCIPCHQKAHEHEFGTWATAKNPRAQNTLAG